LFLMRPKPEFIQPSLLMKGENGKSMSLTYLAPSAAPSPLEAVQAAPHDAKLHLPKKQKLKAKPQPQRPQAERDLEAENEAPKSGATNGSMYDGVMSGHDVRPALPLVFPDPPVSHAELEGAEGDVIIEVTIDENGDVTDTKLLQGLGGSVEQKVIATVRTWHFKPATRDGIPIASRQDVRFHYPS